MDLTYRLSPEERREMMRKRIAFIQETTKGYSSIEEYPRDKDEWFAILGISLTLRDDCISLYNYIEYNDYEDYYVVPTVDGRLAVSHVIWWQDPYCANDVFNIFTEKSVDVENILTTY